MTQLHDKAASHRARVRDYVKNRGHVSFVEILNEFPEFAGNLSITYRDPNIVLWTGFNDEAIDLLNDMLKRKELHLWPATVLTYLTDGGGLSLPQVKSIKTRYKKPRWLPVTLHHSAMTDRDVREARKGGIDIPWPSK